MDQPHIYLNTASCGLISPASLAAGKELYKAFAANASGASEAWRNEEEAATRRLLAGFVGAPPQNIAMVPNFSWAWNAVVQALKGHERVLLYRHDYPSLLEPFRIKNFPITWIDAPDGFNIDLSAMYDAIIARRVDVVAISHVQWTSGYRLDLQKIGSLCRENDVLFMVDGTQSLGACVLKLAELPVDVFASSHYKWMNAGFGNGMLYLTDEFMECYPPVVGGHNSYRMVEDRWTYVPSVICYEPGSPNMFGLRVLADAVSQKNDLGLDYIEQHNLHLARLFVGQLGDAPVKLLGDRTMTNRSPIIHLIDDNGLGQHIKDHHITITQRNGLLRVSMHFYNTEHEVETLATCIRNFYA